MTVCTCRQGVTKLRHRLMIVAHAGAAGHRGTEITCQLLRERFYWPAMEQDVKSMLHQCLLCVKTRGGKVTPRPIGEAVTGNEPGEALHIRGEMGALPSHPHILPRG